VDNVKSKNFRKGMVIMEELELFAKIAENYRAVRPNVRRFYDKHPDMLEKFADFMKEGENYQKHQISLPSFELFCQELSPAEVMYFIQNCVQSDDANEFIGESDVLFKLLSELARRAEAAVFIPTEEEMQEIVNQYKLTAKKIHGKSFEFSGKKSKTKLFNIEIFPVANEMFIRHHGINFKQKIKNNDLCNTIKNELKNMIISKIENDLSYRLSLATGQFQVKVF
jgi:hypothetical protein